MTATKRAAVLLIFPLMIIALVACGSETDEVASGSSGSSADSGTAVAVAEVDDHEDDAEAHAEETVVAIHDEDPHDDSIAEDHTELASDADEHPHGATVVDPDAPVMHILGNEFGYEAVKNEVEAGHPFTIMFHNEGNLEHDITFEGMEEMGGIHLQPGEDGKATFSISEVGEFSYYCTLPGHLEAGMVSKLTVMASSDGDHDEDDGHEDAVEELHDDGTDDHDDDAAGA